MSTTALIIATWFVLGGIGGYLEGSRRGHPALGTVIGAYTGLLGLVVALLMYHSRRSAIRSPKAA